MCLFGQLVLGIFCVTDLVLDGVGHTDMKGNSPITNCSLANQRFVNGKIISRHNKCYVNVIYTLSGGPRGKNNCLGEYREASKWKGHLSGF